MTAGVMDEMTLCMVAARRSVMRVRLTFGAARISQILSSILHLQMPLST